MDFFKDMMYGSNNSMNFKYYIASFDKKDLQVNYSDNNSLEYPSMYEVVLENKEQVNKDILSFVLYNFFNKSQEMIADILSISENEDSIKCNVYTKDIAETKMFQVEEFAKEKKYSLKCVLKKAN